jgi:hypothetical protein
MAAPAIRRRPTVLFSTTRMWNPGDELILAGVRRLLEAVIGPFNTVIYNRNPSLHALRMQFDKLTDVSLEGHNAKANLYQVLAPHLGHYDNSWHGGMSLATIDLVVFAGTPEWMGEMVSPLTDRLVDSSVPVIYLGVGAFEGTRNLSFEALPPNDRHVLERARLITVRDPDCANTLSSVKTHHLPCPALFSAPAATRRNNMEKVAVSLQGSGAGNGQRIDESVLDLGVSIYHKLAARYATTLVLHYAEELDDVIAARGIDGPFVYSSDANELLELYNQFDITVTTRIHGAGACASLGVPSVLLAHSARSGTVDGFLSEQLDPTTVTADGALAHIEALDVAARSARLVAHREETWNRYLALLTPVLSDLAPTPGI